MGCPFGGPSQWPKKKQDKVAQLEGPLASLESIKIELFFFRSLDNDRSPVLAVKVLPKNPTKALRIPKASRIHLQKPRY